MTPLYEQLTIQASAGSGPSATTAVDDSSLSHLARELQLERRRIEVITNILGGWVWETDSEHRFTYMSPSVARFAGKPPEWHYGKTRQELGNMSVRTADGQSWIDQLGRHVVGSTYAGEREPLIVLVQELADAEV